MDAVIESLDLLFVAGNQLIGSTFDSQRVDLCLQFSVFFLHDLDGAGMSFVVVDGGFQFVEGKNFFSKTCEVSVFFTNETLDSGIRNLEVSNEEGGLNNARSVCIDFSENVDDDRVNFRTNSGEVGLQLVERLSVGIDIALELSKFGIVFLL